MQQSHLPLNFDSKDFYQFLIARISLQLFASLANEKKRINKLDQEEKILLSYLLQNFVPQVSKAYLRDQIKAIQVPWYKLTYKKCLCTRQISQNHYPIRVLPS